MNKMRVALYGAGFDGDGTDVICPKPQRSDLAACHVPNFRNPVHKKCSFPVTSSEYDAGDEILEILLNKNACGKNLNVDSSIPYFRGSPPSRASNPLIHDEHFVQQSLQSSKLKPPNRPTSQFTPSVRIEGFHCSGELEASFSMLAFSQQFC